MPDTDFPSVASAAVSGTPVAAPVPVAVAASARSGPLIIVLNAVSGRNDADVIRDTLERVFRQAERRFTVLLASSGEQVVRMANEACALASAQGGVVVAAGGDGTINAVAQQVLGKALPFGVLPQGTFNYFGRVHGISQDTEEAAQALLRAEVRPAQVGRINGQLFLVNGSVGLYPQILEDREAWKQEYGRSRFIAFGSGLVTLVRERRQLQLKIDPEDGDPVDLRTPTLFVGNNPLQLERLGIEPAHVAAVRQGQLAGIVVRPIGTAAMLGLALRGAIGQLGDANHIESFAFRRMTVTPRGAKRIKVATDGEIRWMRTPLVFEVAPQPLWLLVPSPQDRVEVA